MLFAYYLFIYYILIPLKREQGQLHLKIKQVSPSSPRVEMMNRLRILALCGEI